jgi:hypothetical protein
VITKYQSVIEMMCKKEDFLDKEIDIFDDVCYKFYVGWLKIANGRDGITNYIHMFGAGHLTYYLKHYHNLNWYSQQGWESMNSLLKTFFCRTQ